MSKIILLDIDGVCADFAGHVIQALKDDGVTEYTTDDMDNYPLLDVFSKTHRKQVDRLAYNAHWCNTVPRYPGAQAFVQALTMRGMVHMITAPFTGPYWAQAREEWIESFLSASWGNKVSFEWVDAEDRKNMGGDVLIEDRHDTATEWAKTKRKAILIDRPWNRFEDKGIHRAHSYTEVLHHVESA